MVGLKLYNLVYGLRVFRKIFKMDFADFASALAVVLAALFGGWSTLVNAQTKKYSESFKSEIEDLKKSREFLNDENGFLREKIDRLYLAHEDQMAALREFYEGQIKSLKARVAELESKQR